MRTHAQADFSRRAFRAYIKRTPEFRGTQPSLSLRLAAIILPPKALTEDARAGVESRPYLAKGGAHNDNF